jgi:hypothetical protein
MTLPLVTPVKAGAQRTGAQAVGRGKKESWMPAYAGMTGDER